MLTLWKVKLKHKRVRCCSIVGTDGFGMQFRCAACSGSGVAAAQECCVRNTDNASFLQFHDRNSIRQKGQRHNRHSRRNPRCGFTCRRIGKWGASSVHIRGNGTIFSELYSGISFAA